MNQKRILVPTRNPETWKGLLADPDKHWKSGYSAKSTAYSWESSKGLPEEVASIYRNSINESLQKAELALAIPEYKVGLAGGSRASQNDVFALLTCPSGLISMTVEGKAREDFDRLLGDWKKKTSPNGAASRLKEIQENIGLADEIPDSIRYQLLHRTASAVIEARRFHAPHAVMLVQSFVDDDEQNHFQDFCNFVELFGKSPLKETLIEISRPDGITLYVAWVQSKPM